MKLLVDTNVFLEIILEQEKAAEAKALLTKTEEHQFYISDYSVHSIGLLLFRRKQHDVFREFLNDVLRQAGTSVVSLPADSLGSAIEAAQRYNLDFDDAYQYAAAENHGLTIVSFDADFDRTERGRKAPSEALVS